MLLKKNCCLLFYIDCIEIVPILAGYCVCVCVCGWVEIEVKFFMVSVDDLCMAQTIIFHLSSLSMSINFFCIISSLFQLVYCFNSLNCYCCNWNLHLYTKNYEFICHLSINLSVVFILFPSSMFRVFHKWAFFGAAVFPLLFFIHLFYSTLKSKQNT